MNPYTSRGAPGGGGTFRFSHGWLCYLIYPQTPTYWVDHNGRTSEDFVSLPKATSFLPSTLYSSWNRIKIGIMHFYSNIKVQSSKSIPEEREPILPTSNNVMNVVELDLMNRYCAGQEVGDRVWSPLNLLRDCKRECEALHPVLALVWWATNRKDPLGETWMMTSIHFSLICEFEVGKKIAMRICMFTGSPIKIHIPLSI